ncbi:MAG TPA: hypothetical protein VGH58_01300 [Solirubrobacterales bacterium]|jgi:hypothetical protein
MTVIRTHDDEHDVSCDADALDAFLTEVERDGASGADVAVLADTILAARSGGYGTGVSTSRPAVAVLTTTRPAERRPSPATGSPMAPGATSTADPVRSDSPRRSPIASPAATFSPRGR